MDGKFLESAVSMNCDYWDYMRKIKDAVSKNLQHSRDKKVIGSSLDAQVDFYADHAERILLHRLEGELPYFFIVSIANLHSSLDVTEDAQETDIPGLCVAISFSPHPKCERCYHRRKDVNLDKKFPGICYRCIDVIQGKAEVRKYV